MVRIRRPKPIDYAVIDEVVRTAFWNNEPDETVVFLGRLRADGCILAEWLAENENGIVGHIAFSRVWIEPCSGSRIPAAMLTPLAVRPDHQRRGCGMKLMEFSIDALEREGETVFLVLGHPAYYPRAGFKSDLARTIKNPWGDNPAFMARGSAIPSGLLVLPKPIAEAH